MGSPADERGERSKEKIEMEMLNGNLQYEVNAGRRNDCNISMSGCAVETAGGFRAETVRIVEKACVTVKVSVARWRVVPGLERRLNTLCIVIVAGVRAAFRQAVCKFKRHLMRVKSAVNAQKPCFLRL